MLRLVGDMGLIDAGCTYDLIYIFFVFGAGRGGVLFVFGSFPSAFCFMNERTTLTCCRGAWAQVYAVTIPYTMAVLVSNEQNRIKSNDPTTTEAKKIRLAARCCTDVQGR
jgi:hypothetical protein